VTFQENDDDEEETFTNCLSEHVSRRMSRLGKFKRFSKGISSNLNKRFRQLQQRKPNSRGSAINRVTQRISGRFKRQLAWRSLEADEQLTAMRHSYASKPLTAIFAKPCFQFAFAVLALVSLLLLAGSYSKLAEDSSVRRFRHYRWVAEGPSPMLAFGVGCSGLGCGPALLQVPRVQAPHGTVAAGSASVSGDAPFPANLFFLVVPEGALGELGPFVVEGSLDGRAWERVWPGAGPWGPGPGAEEGGMKPVLKANSVDAVDWFTAEACRNGTATAGVECGTGTIIRKDLYLHWHQHLTVLNRIESSLAILLASAAGACGKPQLARPILLTGATLYGVSSAALAWGKLAYRELSKEWAEVPGIFLVVVGVLACEAQLFFHVILGLSLSLALLGARGGLCQLLDLPARGLACSGGDAWQLQLMSSLLLALWALAAACVARSSAAGPQRRVLRFPPQRFSFLGAEGLRAQQELLAFGVVRSVFGLEERDFRESAHRLLSKVVATGQRSSAKSGALMAFEDGLMVKSMTAMEASTLLAILRPYLTHLEARGGTSTMLPRFFGAYIHQGMLGQQTFFAITANVFADVPPSIMQAMEKFDLKGSSDDRAQRQQGSELMDFDLLREDRKLAAAEAAQGQELHRQLQKDVQFLREQLMPIGPCGVLNCEGFQEAYRGAPGLMDYSLLVGLVPRGTPGGLVRLDVCDERTVAGPDEESPWTVEAREMTVLIGIIDILQFWTPTKRAARFLKKGLGKERDLDGGYHGEILDTVKPEPYSIRFLGFMGEVFTPGSWLDSLPRMYGGDWSRVTALQVHQLPEPQRDEALERQRTCASEVKLRRSTAEIVLSSLTSGQL